MRYDYCLEVIHLYLTPFYFKVILKMVSWIWFPEFSHQYPFFYVKWQHFLFVRAVLNDSSSLSWVFVAPPSWIFPNLFNREQSRRNQGQSPPHILTDYLTLSYSGGDRLANYCSLPRIFRPSYGPVIAECRCSYWCNSIKKWSNFTFCDVTKNFIKASLFQRIYNLYSGSGHWVQWNKKNPNSALK